MNPFSDDSDDSDESSGSFIPPIIPAGAPPELVTLATNISEILQPIQAHRGVQYTTQLLILCTLFQQAGELEHISCQATSTIIQDIPQYSEIAREKHDTAHILADAISNSLHRLVDFHESLPEFKGISKDLETLMNRIKTDWKDKGH
jgi:hypothetical protein